MTAVRTPKLTIRQARVHRYMLAYQREHGMPPTLREIMNALGIDSPNGVRCHLGPMVAKGYARQTGAKLSRSYIAVDRDAPRCECCGQPLPMEFRAGLNASHV